jgi:hypothetical protein
MIMNLTRRKLLMLGLGGTQLALLSKFGLGSVHAQASGRPSKLLTIYVPGGWLPQLLFPSMSNSQITKQISTLGPDGPGGPVFYQAGQVIAANTASLAYDPGPQSIKQPVRFARLWDPANGNNDAAGFNPNGYSWMKNKLWENMCVLHGIDQGTADHQGGQVASMSGAAGSEYRCPSMHAVIANALYETYKDARPIASVSAGSLLYPNPYGLTNGSATIMPRLDSLRETFTQRNDTTWKDLGQRSPLQTPGFDGKSPEEISATAADGYVLRETARLRGGSYAGTDGYLENLYNRFKGVSKVLARDVVTTLEGTPGIKNIDDYSVGIGGGGYRTDAGGSWKEQFDLALKLLRSNLTTSVAIDTLGPGLFYFDTHGQTFANHGNVLKQVHEIIGRFLGEMKASPGVAGGKSLLDETLVVIMSEFGRSPANNDHWPITSVVLAGGGINADLQVGNYDVEGMPDKHPAQGLPVDIKEEDGRMNKRRPKASDVCTTVYKILGVDKFFIPGGYGEILGVVKS